MPLRQIMPPLPAAASFRAFAFSARAGDYAYSSRARSRRFISARHSPERIFLPCRCHCHYFSRHASFMAAAVLPLRMASQPVTFHFRFSLVDAFQLILLHIDFAISHYLSAEPRHFQLLRFSFAIFAAARLRHYAGFLHLHIISSLRCISFAIIEHFHAAFTIEVFIH